MSKEERTKEATGAPQRADPEDNLYDDIDDFEIDIKMEELERIGDPRTPGCLKLRDRMVFFLGVVNVLVMAFFVHGVPWLMPWYYIVKAPVLIGLRIFLYFREKYQYFLIDFCYWANLLLLFYLIVFPSSKELFVVAYSIAHGPLAWAVCLFKNSLVFHSLDKITSAFIHISPMLVTYCIRWFAEKFPEDQRFKVCSPDEPCSTFFYTGVIPIGFYVCWILAYGIGIKWVCPMPSEQYLTSYRYLTRRKGGPLKVLGTMKYGWLIYGFVNVFVAFLMLCPTILYYNVQAVNFIFAVVIVSVCIWNGAGFYISVFSKRYQKSIEKELEKAI